MHLVLGRWPLYAATTNIKIHAVMPNSENVYFQVTVDNAQKCLELKVHFGALMTRAFLDSNTTSCQRRRCQVLLLQQEKVGSTSCLH